MCGKEEEKESSPPLHLSLSLSVPKHREIVNKVKLRAHKVFLPKTVEEKKHILFCMNHVRD